MSIRIVPHGTTAQNTPAQKAFAGAARCAVSRKGALNKKIQQKEKEKAVLH
ncbi:MAG: hypothetical protein ACI3XN_03660 [Eubacteriales bacterium]